MESFNSSHIFAIVENCVVLTCNGIKRKTVTDNPIITKKENCQNKMEFPTNMLLISLSNDYLYKFIVHLLYLQIW